MSYEEEDICMSYEEEDTCMSYGSNMRRRIHTRLKAIRGAPKGVTCYKEKILKSQCPSTFTIEKSPYKVLSRIFAKPPETAHHLVCDEQHLVLARDGPNLYKCIHI